MPEIDMNEYNNASESTGGGGFEQMKPGAYVLKIVRIKTEGETRYGKWTAAEKQYVQIIWDVAEGPHAGRYSESYFDDPDRDFMHCDYLSWKNLSFLKKKLNAITASNPGFDALAAFRADRWDMFKGRLFGAVIDGTVDTNDRGYDRWKLSVGDLAGRREIPNTWGGMQTMDVGFYEYFCLCEEIGALPVPVVHAGLLCQARDAKDPPLTMEETERYAQDILNLIDFALGDEGTEWGRVRIQMGHPEPFDLRYLAIGNENWGAAYFGRYELLSKAVKEKHPDITCIVAAGPVAEGSLIQDSWNQIRRRFADDLVDEHYYMDSSWFPSHVNRYDRYPRTTKVFLGEFAAHEPVQGSRRPGNLYAALCEAAYLTGIERNSDLVEMCCYAPLLCREGEVDWTPDLIWFNDEQVYGTPSYYVQQMFSESCGTELVASETDGNLFHAATRTDSELQIKIVNLSDKASQLRLLLPGVPDQATSAQVLTGEKNHVNSFARPDKVAPKSVQTVCFGGQAETELPPWSLTVLKFSLEK